MKAAGKINLCSVVMPNWNGLEYLKVSLPSLKKQTFPNLEIIIVDNGSTDGSVDYISKYYKNIRLIKLDKNYGFVGAVNIGIKAALGQYLLLLNNDTEVDKVAIEQLVKALQVNPKVGFVAPKLLNFYQRQLIDSAGDEINSVGQAQSVGHGQKDGPIYNQSKSVFLATAGGSLFRHQLFDKVGLLDEDYFIYFEDVDLGLRAQLMGYQGLFEPKAKIYHINKATMSKRSQLSEYLLFRNLTITVIKCFPKGLLMDHFNWLRILLVNFGTVRQMAQRGYLKQALKAEIYVLSHLGAILKKRAQIQSTKTVSDQYFIDNIKSKRITLFGLFPEGI